MTMDNGMDVSPSWEELREERDALAEERQGLRKVIATLGAENREIRRESEALAAHVIRLMGALELARDRIALLAEIATDRGAKVYAALDMWPEEVAEILAESPTTSLARLKAEWQAEALFELAPCLITKADQQIARHKARCHLQQRQAEGDHP